MLTLSQRIDDGHEDDEAELSLKGPLRVLRAVSRVKSGAASPTSTAIFHPYLLRDLDAIRPGEVWCADITCIPVRGGFFHLVAVMDWASPATIQRIWDAHGLQPHRVETFKLSKDPEFVDKLTDIVGLYLNPPDKAAVICVDERVGFRHSIEPSPVCR